MRPMRDMIVTVTLQAVYRNPNPPHVYPATPALVERCMRNNLENNQENLCWLDTKNKSGLFQRDSFPAALIRSSAHVRRATWFDRLLSYFGLGPLASVKTRA